MRSSRRGTRAVAHAGTVLLLGAIGIASAGCERESTTASSASTGASAVPGHAPTAPASERGTPAPSASAAETIPHCAAIGRSEPVRLGEVPDELLQLRVEGGFVYVLSFHEGMARVRWSRLSTHGGKPEPLAEVISNGIPSTVVATRGMAFFTQAGKLHRLEAGGSRVLATEANSAVALHGASLFFVECERAAKADFLREIPVEGGEARLVAELPHAPGKRCDYPSLLADEREVFLADWNTQEVRAVSRHDGSTRVLVHKRGFPESLLFEGQNLVFLSARGLERVPRGGGALERLLDAEVLASPFSDVLWSKGEFWFVDRLAYVTTERLYRLGVSEKSPRVVVAYKSRSPVESSPGDEHLGGFAVDEECAYWVRSKPEQKTGAVFAKAR